MSANYMAHAKQYLIDGTLSLVDLSRPGPADQRFHVCPYLNIQSMRRKATEKVVITLRHSHRKKIEWCVDIIFSFTYHFLKHMNYLRWMTVLFLKTMSWWGRVSLAVTAPHLSMLLNTVLSPWCMINSVAFYWDGNGYLVRRSSRILFLPWAIH